MDPELEPTADEADLAEQHENWSESDGDVPDSAIDADREEPLDEESIQEEFGDLH